MEIFDKDIDQVDDKMNSRNNRRKLWDCKLSFINDVLREISGPTEITLNHHKADLLDTEDGCTRDM